MLAELAADWDFVVDGPTRSGPDATLVDVQMATGELGLLSISTQPGERDERIALGLQHWSGRGAVRLIRANPRRGLLITERLGQDLSQAWDVQACESIGALYRELDRAAPVQLPLLSQYVASAGEQLKLAGKSVGLPPRMVDQAISLARSFGADGETDGRLIHGHLGYNQVAESLQVERPGWRALAAEPLSGDWGWEVFPLLSERFDELAGRIREGVRDRFFAAIDAAELDEQRAKNWVIVRAVTDFVQEVANSPEEARDLATKTIAIVKAMED